MEKKKVFLTSGEGNSFPMTFEFYNLADMK